MRGARIALLEITCTEGQEIEKVEEVYGRLGAGERDPSIISATMNLPFLRE